MSKELYMMEIVQVLEKVSAVACRKNCPKGGLEVVKGAAIHILIGHYGLNLDDAQDSVAVAAGEKI